MPAALNELDSDSLLVALASTGVSSVVVHL